MATLFFFADHMLVHETAKAVEGETCDDEPADDAKHGDLLFLARDGGAGLGQYAG